MKHALTCAALDAIATAIFLPFSVQAAMPAAHDCALGDPASDLQSTAHRASATSDRRDRMQTRAPRACTLHAASLESADPRVHTGSAHALVGDRNLQAMLESAVGDSEPMTRLIGSGTLVAIRDAENARRAPGKFQARITVVRRSQQGRLHRRGRPYGCHLRHRQRARRRWCPARSRPLPRDSCALTAGPRLSASGAPFRADPLA